MLRSREMQATLQRLNDAEDAGAVEQAINGYLQARWGIDAERLTAAERAQAFARVQSNGLATDELRRIFAECERARFGPGERSPADETRAWVLGLEADNP